jgi:multisubunit Na+/H+ antiporter MnhB subunit
MMKFLFGLLFAVAIILFTIAAIWHAKETDSESRADAALPCILGVIVLGVDFLMFIGWVIWSL